MAGGITTSEHCATPFGAAFQLASPNVKAGGHPVVLESSPLSPHGPIPGHGEIPSFMNTSSTSVRINGAGVIRQGDVASCGDEATGHPKIMVGD
tara:strand:- start:3891 stop:4172 length:282 start_codon:yes stop_codon:yes gene_type:complete